MRPRVIVAGAGVAGLSVARALARLGCRSRVVAPRNPGDTAWGAGIASAQFWDEVLAPFALRSLEILGTLRVPVHRCGMAQIATSEKCAAFLGRIIRIRQTLGRPVQEKLPEPLASSLNPAFRRRIVRATFAKEDLWIRPRDLLRALGSAIQIEGRVEDDGTVRAGRDKLDCDILVLATGAWGPRDRRARLWRSQAIRATGVSAPAMLHVLETGVYLRPDGAALVAGNGNEPWSGPPEEAAHVGEGEWARRMAARLRAMLGGTPRVAGAWAGLVVMTPDRRPFAGPSDASGRVWRIGGLGGDGLSLAPALGESLACAILERRSPLDLRPFRLH